MSKTPSTNGKGDRDRVKNLAAYRDNWEAIYRKRKPLIHCASDRDGECCHPDCPQIRDNEPHATGRHCPLDYRDPYEEAV